VTTRGATQAYTADEIDFIAVYIVPENPWYVIPISIAASRDKMYVSPNRALHSKYEKFREAWCQMACPHDEISPTRLLVKRQPDYPFDTCELCNQQCPLKESAVKLSRDRRRRWQKFFVSSEAGKDRRGPHRTQNV
jgi:Pyruvate/2-oxoacid:ferredoxin oxidoreductase delta subunit